MKTITPSADHTQYMRKAIEQAQKAVAHDEVPVGAVIVDAKGDIISCANNAVVRQKSQTAHAELRALAKAGKKMGDWRLEGCSLYVTLEPCAMCMNAIILSRLDTVIFGAASPLFGSSKIEKEQPERLYKKDSLAIISGVLEKDSILLLQQFFKQKRKKNE